MSIFTHRRSPNSMRRFYNWFHRFYGAIEAHLHADLETAVKQHVDAIEDCGQKTAVEFACGSGLLTRMLARRFSGVIAVDQSEGMLARAARRCADLSPAPRFLNENILTLTGDTARADWGFMSFALHLFSPDDGEQILRAMLRQCREGIIIFDHRRTWQPLTAIAEWIEGSHYDQFLHMNFTEIAHRIDASGFSETECAGLCVLTFRR